MTLRRWGRFNIWAGAIVLAITAIVRPLGGSWSSVIIGVLVGLSLIFGGISFRSGRADSKPLD